MSNEWRLPAPYQREAYDPDGLFRNPAQTLPLPVPNAPPVGVWIGPREPISWQSDGGNAYKATWGSPVFDLRPSLRGLVERSNQTGNAQGATPIWVASGIGSGGKLFIQIDDLDQINSTADVEIYAQEYAAIADVGLLNSITPEVNVTLNVVNGGGFNSAIVPFTPRGEGYPVRYWQIRLTFRRGGKGIGVPYPMRVQGAYY